MTKIVQLSDCHLFKDKNKVGYNNINPYQSLQLLLDKVEQLNPDGVLVTGDISGDDSEQSYQHFLTLMAQFNLSNKFKVIAGNHDQSNAFNKLLANLDLANSQPWQIHNWFLHGIDTRYQDTLGRVSDKDLGNLKNNLQNSPNNFHLIACHHHPLASGGWMDKHQWLNRDDFVNAVTTLPQVKLVVYGHIHHDSQHKILECDFHSSPSTCWQFASQADFAISEEMPGFKLYHLHNNGSFDSTTFRLQQEQFK
ncbi:MAG: metallophosphoesterase [Aliiglaciecola sp.]|uniref:metallophosphoesterase family protein n=1 Tax=Aliiglaciecola sp. TaxID=1872441 RepID=UPI00329848B7